MTAGGEPHGDDGGDVARARLVLDLRARGILDPAVLKAIEKTPRVLFVDPALADIADDDRALPIDCGQTISQPFVVAYMTETLKLNDRHKVLEIGTGSGYQTAVLARICRRVYSIERYRSLMAAAEKRLAALRISNATLINADGYDGWPAQAPFDRIIVTASALEVPEKLKQQLKPGGILISPVGPHDGDQQLVRVVRNEDASFSETRLLPVRFVAMVPGKAAHL
ncbi:MAG: protein-L-isoaspartate(D-aspartate) O-methyltransferase [Flavobacteriaceae bacterium]